MSGTGIGFGSLMGFISVYDEATFNRLGELHGRHLANTIFQVEGSIANRPGALTFTLSPADQMYVWAALFATADRRDAVSSSANTFNTLTIAFHDATGPVPASVIPEPSVATRLGFGLLLVFAEAGRNDLRRT